MSVSGSGIVLCRLSAVFLLVRGIEHLGFALSYATSPWAESWQAAFTSLFSVVAPTVAAFLVWRLAPLICRIEDSNADPDVAAVGSEEVLLSVGTFLVGLYVLLFGLVNAVSVEVNFWTQNTLNSGTAFPTDGAWIQGLSMRAPYAVQIGLGLILVLGRGGIASAVSKARYAGRGAS